jgi:hypothetical protein
LGNRAPAIAGRADALGQVFEGYVFVFLQHFIQAAQQHANAFNFF